MIREYIAGDNNRNYTLEELIKEKQLKYPYGIPENSLLFYFQNMSPEDLDGETFKKAFMYYHYPVEVSDFGRVRYRNKIIKQEDNISNHPNGGWLWLNCPEYKILHHVYVYKLVTDTWLGRNPGRRGDWYERHHINNNGYDNRPSNLIWLTKEEHKEIPVPKDIKEFTDVIS